MPNDLCYIKTINTH